MSEPTVQTYNSNRYQRARIKINLNENETVRTIVSHRPSKFFISLPSNNRNGSVKRQLFFYRIKLSKELGFHATGGVFTSARAQKSAEKAGMECLYQIPYKKFGKQCGIKFNTDTEELKIYAVKIE